MKMRLIKFFATSYIFVIVSIIAYVIMSIINTSWDPIDWTYNILQYIFALVLVLFATFFSIKFIFRNIKY